MSGMGVRRNNIYIIFCFVFVIFIVVPNNYVYGAFTRVESLFVNGGFEEPIIIDYGYQYNYTGNWVGYQTFPFTTDQFYTTEGTISRIGYPGLLIQCIDVTSVSLKNLRIQVMHTLHDVVTNSPGMDLRFAYYSTDFSQEEILDTIRLPGEDITTVWRQYDMTISIPPNVNNLSLFCFIFYLAGFVDDIIIVEDSSIVYDKVGNPDFEDFNEITLPFPSSYPLGVEYYRWYNSKAANVHLAEGEWYGVADYNEDTNDILQCFPASDFVSNYSVRLQFLLLQNASFTSGSLNLWYDLEIIGTVSLYSNNIDYNDRWYQYDFKFDIPVAPPGTMNLCLQFYIGNGNGIDHVIFSVVNACENVECIDTDSDFCTDYVCQRGECVYVEHACEDDGLDCTTESCYAGACHSDINCAESKNCEDVVCDSKEGICVYTTKCNQTDLCNPDVCVMNECVASVACPDDGDICTIETCDPKTGKCGVESKDCEDGDICTVNLCDQKQGGCYQVDYNCDDGDICTVDLCNRKRGGCYHVDYNCDDGDLCTVDTCNSDSTDGKQCSHSTITCNDNNYCTIDTCDKTKGCVFTSVSCNDNNSCTNDLCDPKDSDGDPCYFLEKNTCNDGNRCTTDSCDAKAGCVHEVVNCDDNNKCTFDHCDIVRGCQYTTNKCDDNNDCTIDSCDPTLGCQHTQSSIGVCAVNCLSFIDCDDNNKCTIDQCIGTSCVLSPVDCDDSNRCTLDTCSASNGCVHLQIGGSCSANGGSSKGSTHYNDNHSQLIDKVFNRF